MSNKKVVIIGAGGHAKVIADIIIKSQDEIIGFLDDNLEAGTKVIEDYKVIGDLNNRFAIQLKNEEYEFVIAIGDNKKRKEIAVNSPTIRWYKAIHPSAQIGIDVTIDEGTVIMPNTIINACTKIGKHCIINSGAIIEHENKIDNFVHISPNSALAGNVKVGECTHIGIGSNIINNINICSNCIIGAGATIVENIEKQGTYIGIPARLYKK